MGLYRKVRPNTSRDYLSTRPTAHARAGTWRYYQMADWLELLDEFFKSEQKKGNNECQAKEKGSLSDKVNCRKLFGD